MTDQAIVDHKRSVKSAEFGKNAAGKFVFWLPRYSTSTVSALPPELPEAVMYPNYGIYPNARDTILMSTPKFESMWGGVVGIEASKFVASAWALQGDKPRIQDRFQNILLNSTTGVLTGWVPFSSAGFIGYINTGKRFIEIERYTSRAGSRIKAFHHLDPTRCFLTTDPEIPVLYVDSNGREHEIKRHQIMMFFDNPDPQEANVNAPYSAAVRAYQSIVLLAAVKWYLYEKVTGRTPLAFHFVQGISPSTLNDVIASAQEEADSQGVSAYMGAVMAAVMGDSPMNLVSVPLAEIPDKFDVEQIRQDAHLEYANALGMDPTRVDPRLIGNRQLGAGTQSIVLDQKARQGGILVSHKVDFIQRVNQLLRDEKITFFFSEVDYVDQKAAAEVAEIRAGTRKTRIDSGEISIKEARNIAVDVDDLPDEFLAQDETVTETISSEDQPSDSPETNDDETEEATPDDENMDDLKVTEKQIDPENDDELVALIEANLPAAREIFRSAQE